MEIEEKGEKFLSAACRHGGGSPVGLGKITLAISFGPAASCPYTFWICVSMRNYMRAGTSWPKPADTDERGWSKNIPSIATAEAGFVLYKRSLARLHSMAGAGVMVSTMLPPCQKLVPPCPPCSLHAKTLCRSVNNVPSMLGAHSTVPNYTPLPARAHATLSHR